MLVLHRTELSSVWYEMANFDNKFIYREESTSENIKGSDISCRLQFLTHVQQYQVTFYNLESLNGEKRDDKVERGERDVVEEKKLLGLDFQTRFAISTCTARYGRYIPVRQVTGTRTARYRAVPSKIGRRRPIE
ncbi:hypothetical protein GW17_00039200 [Ensete ventricosum]|nr:hypothetical protein GW17_00039200 [Ensete ventricosum]